MGEATSYAYDSHGNLTEVSSASGRKRVYTYNLLNQLVKEEHQLPGQTTPSKVITYTYDANDNLISYLDQENGQKITAGNYVYDANDRITSQTIDYGAFQKTHTFTYTAAGHPKERTDPDQVKGELVWDAAGRFSEAKLDIGKKIAITAHQGEKPKSITWPNSVEQTMAYDPLSRLKALKIKKGGETRLDWLYQYSAAGNIVQISREGKATTYGYDTLGRLTRVSVPEGSQLPNENYTYDNVHNRLTDAKGQQYTYNANRQVTQIQIKNDDLTSLVKSFAYNEDGHLTSETTQETMSLRNFVYDANERMVEIKDNNTTLVRYKYDPFGRRIMKEIGGDITWYGYDDTGLIAEYAATGSQTAAYGYWPDQTWQTAPLYKRENANYHYYHNDALGTPQRLTNEQGEISWEAEYEAFGKTKETINLTQNPLRFPGQYQDGETGLYQNYFRDYNPLLGRYIELDPKLSESNDPYSYANTDPLQYTDPTGEIAPIAGMYARCVLQCAGMTCVMGLISGDGCSPCAGAEDCLLDCLNPFNWGGKKPPKAPFKPKDPKKPVPKPPGDCSSGKQAAMQAGVNAACKPDPGACRYGESRSVMQGKFAAHSACAAARKAINNTCFRGGDSGHQQQYAHRAKMASDCAGYLGVGGH